MNDALTPLIEAYRAENPGTSLDQRALRERVLAAAWRRRQRRARRITWLLPIAAVLVGSGALGATAGRAHVAQLVAWLVAAPRAAVSAGVERRAARAVHPAAQRPPQNPGSISVPALAPTPELPSHPAPELAPIAFEALPAAPDPLPMARSGAAARTGSAAAPPTAALEAAPGASLAAPPVAPVLAPFPAAGTPDPALDADVSAYRSAHRLHFVSASYKPAFAAWNAYLARFPNGTFAPEARLNRAVCLVRLGHVAEARTALSAIATRDGAYGRAQAERLLEALDTER